MLFCENVFADTILFVVVLINPRKQECPVVPIKFGIEGDESSVAAVLLIAGFPLALEMPTKVGREGEEELREILGALTCIIIYLNHVGLIIPSIVDEGIYRETESGVVNTNHCLIVF